MEQSWTRRCKTTSSYLVHALIRTHATIEKAVDDLKSVDCDTLIGTGLSGTLIIPSLALATGRFFAIVRKGEQTHSNRTVEGRIGQRWVFVDDLVETGATLNRVKSAISDLCDNCHHTTQFVGTYTYWAGGFTKA